LLACGSNKNFELGLPEKRNYTELTEMEIGFNVNKIKIGDSHLVVLCQSGEILVSGQNKFCQLGLAHIEDLPARNQ
jgi:alpha-tubulin suppressor-like RCC1 family protein